MPIPRVYDEELHNTIVGYCRNGVRGYRAALASGINDKTFYNWRKLAAKGSEPYASLFQDIKKAESEFVAEATDIMRTDPKRWLPHMTLLERLHPDEYGRRERMDINLQADERMKEIYGD